MTNGEYLRSLSDEELGKRLCDLFGDCKICFASEHCRMGHNGLVAWAKEESDILPFDRQNSQTTCKDCVSRQEAIDAVLKLANADGAYGYADAKDLADCLKNLPSAQPTYTDKEIQKMQDLESAEIEKAYQLGYEEGKKNARYLDKRIMVDIGSIISLEDMKEIMNKSAENSETWGDFYIGIIIGVYKLGLEQGKMASSRKLGNWIKNGKYNYTYKCSVCGETGPFEPIGESVFKFNFCPNCGADMTGEQDETD